MKVTSYKIGELCEIVRGVSFSKSEAKNTFFDGSLPVIRSGSIQKNLKLDKDLLWVNGEKIKAEQKIRKNDILICMSSGSSNLVGKNAISYTDWNGGFGAFCALLRVINDSCLPKYLYYILNSGYFLNWSTCSSGSNIKNIRVSELSEFNINLPSIDEQNTIVSILDKVESIRQKREQAIKLSDDFLRATFLEMFPQLDDCGNKVKLGDIVTLDAPMVDPREDDFIDLIHIGPDRIERNTGLLLPALTAREENLISKKFLFDENYVLYSKIRPYLKKCAIPDFGGLCSADMYPVKPIANKTNREFLWQLLLSNLFTKYTETLPDRANIPKLNRKELLNFEISLPPFYLQENYRKIVQKINNAKSIMRIQSSNNLLDRLTDELFSKD